MGKLCENMEISIGDFISLLEDVIDLLKTCENCTHNLQKEVGERGVQKTPSPFRGACAHAPVLRARMREGHFQTDETSNDTSKITPRTVSSQVKISKGKLILPKNLMQPLHIAVKNKIDKIENAHLPPSVKPIWDFWVANGLHVPQKGTKTFDHCVKAVQQVLRGSFFTNIFPAKSRRYDYDEIRKAISRFAVAATDPDYEPRHKSHLLKLNISTFFWNAYAKSVNSYFLMYLEEKPKHIRGQVDPLEDTHPELTQLVIRKFFNGNIPETLTQHTKNQFIIAAAKLHEFYNEKYLRNVFMSPEPLGQIIDYLQESLAKVFGRGSIKPSNYASDWTFSQCLPNYLSEINAWDVELESE